MPETMDSSTQTCDEHEFGTGARGFMSNRAEIDTSAPFRSVEEAVIRFGGRGFWIPRSILPSDDSVELGICNLEDQAAEMLKDLNTKQQDTLNILGELELTRKLIEDLKLKLQNDSSGFHRQPNDDRTNSTHCPNFHPLSPAGLVMLELKQAKQNLSQSTNDLEAIRASVEQVNNKMERKKISLVKREPQHQQFMRTEILGGNTNAVGISRELRELNYEAEQFMRTAEVAKGEVLKAMSDIERSKTGLKMIEMRWIAAKKLEEAAKATEALALAEIKALPTSQRKQGRISLSFEEYYSLAQKANKDENRSLLNPNETSNGNVARKATTSIGDILSRKLVVRDDLDIGRQGKARGDGERVSLNQMLDRHRTQTPLPPRRAEKSNDGSDSKGFFWKKKGFGFVHISLPLSKQKNGGKENLKGRGGDLSSGGPGQEIGGNGAGKEI